MLHLTHENYFSQEAMMEYMSASQFKEFMKCEARAMARIKGEIEGSKSAALLMGGYIDAYFSGMLDQYQDNYPEIFKLNGELKSDFIFAREIIDRIERDEFLMSVINAAQKQVIVSGEIGNVPFKGMIDFLLPDRIVDMKIMKDFKDVYEPELGCHVTWWQYYDYDLQGAIYKQLEGNNKPFSIIAASKEKAGGIDIDAFNVPELSTHNRLVDIENLARRFQAVKLGLSDPHPCGTCWYCRQKKILNGFREVI